MSTLTFLKYNNWYNKTLKGWTLNSTTDYSSFSPQPYPNLNFDPRDGVDTVHYINDSVLTDFKYDYVLVSDDNSTVIKSKWFVIDAVWNRKHQWEIRMHRDLKADLYTGYSTMPFFCRNGMVSGTTDPLVYRTESLSWNQILDKREILRQTSGQGTGYIIGFTEQSQTSFRPNVNGTWAREYKTLEDVPVYKYVNQGYQEFPEQVAVRFRLANVADPTPAHVATGTVKYLTVTLQDNRYGRWNANGEWVYDSVLDPVIVTTGPNSISPLGSTEGNTNLANMGTDMMQDSAAHNYMYNLQSQAESQFGQLFDQEANDFWSMYNDEQVKVGGTVYKFKLSALSSGEGWNYTADMDEDTRRYVCTLLKDTAIDNGFNAWYYAQGETSAYPGAIYAMKSYKRTVTMTEVQTMTPRIHVTANIPGKPYNIFVIPDSKYAREYAASFASNYPGIVYDLQMFPYAPPLDTTGKQLITPTGQTAEYLYWATSDSNHGNLIHNAIKTYSTIKEKKTGANMDLCRIFSPNGASAWDFNPAMIGGVAANSIRYEMTLIPGSSYLHIFPTFGGIYGSVNKALTGTEAGGPGREGTCETRGFICSGPWSFPYTTNMMREYEIQNAAYRDAHIRDIQHMNRTQDISMDLQLKSSFLSAGQGIASGAAAGAKTGNAIATAAGAAIGGSVAGLTTSWEFDAARQIDAEARSYLQDQFACKIKSIEAQPQPLTQNSSLTVGSGILPFIEYYTSTADEKTHLENYLKENGYTIGIMTNFATMVSRAGTLENSNIISNFVSGHLIRFGGTESFHEVNVLGQELERGVYIDG